MHTSTIRLSSQKGCRLAIGAYPPFDYDATNGGGEGTLSPSNEDGKQNLYFNPKKLIIPNLSWQTTKILGLPIPPGLKITVKTKKLEGFLSKNNEELSLNFDARFLFTIGNLISAPQLIVTTCLTSGKVDSKRYQTSGQPLQSNGNAVLVGVATIQPSGAAWLDRFLGLPDEALAVLRCKLKTNPGSMVNKIKFKNN